MMFQSKCLLLVVLVGPKLGFAVRSAAMELDDASADINHLRVLYKHCFAAALKEAAQDQRNYAPIITKDGDEDTEFDKIYGHWILLRMSNIQCPIELTEEPALQHDIPFSEIQDVFKDGSGKQVYEAYKGRPKKTWFELGLGDEVNNALKELYKSAMRYKSSFYINDWVISGECGSSASGEWKTERCHDLLLGKVEGGQIKFQANEQGPGKGSTIHIADDGKETLDASKVFDAAFTESCTNSLNTADSKYEGISSQLCSGQKFYECAKEDKDGTSIEWCSNGVVGNVGWNDGGFYWK